jgi:zinc transport system substrate-binding protein
MGGCAVRVDIDVGDLVNKHLIVFFAFVLAACEPVGKDVSVEVVTAGTMSPPVVYTVNYPLAWMAETIGGDAVEIVMPVPPTEDPAHWQPSAQQVLAYQDADLVLLNGAGYAGWTTLAFLSPAKLVDTTAGATDRLVPAGEVRHSHGPGGDQNNTDIASHTWLSPDLAAEQARVIAAALIELVPGPAEGMEGRTDILVEDLRQWDDALGEAFENLGNRQFIFSHPVYQYLNSHYGLQGQSVAWEPHKEPDEDQWRMLGNLIDQGRSPVMLWEALPLASVSDRLGKMGIDIIVFGTGSNPHPRKGYDVVVEENLSNIRALDSGAGSPIPAPEVDQND